MQPSTESITTLPTPASQPPGKPAMPLFTTLEKYDAEREETQGLVLGDEQYPNEPVFVRRPDAASEDADNVLTVVYDGFALPISFHGNWLAA